MHHLLPIDFLKDQIVRLATREQGVLIQSPTGSGKSTRVAQFLVDHVVGPQQQVLVLQPRRIAARVLASWVAAERKSEVGREVGYHIRFENHSRPDTRIVFLTEGVLLRRLLANDPLENVGAVLFDEFHERHLETDLTLSMVVNLQKTVRPDLKWLIMSATVQLDQLPTPLKNIPSITAEGRSYPVRIEYLHTHSSLPVWDSAARLCEKAAAEVSEGSVLVFMPGSYEIRKTLEAIGRSTQLKGFEALPLFSGLPRSEQDRALAAPAHPLERKIIVATNVAETSLTIPGIIAVVDSGSAKIARFDPTRGVNGLFIEPISRSSADQRAGRAGRTAPGICYRLWPAHHHDSRPLAEDPEINRIDLSGTMLGILSAGFPSAEAFPWLEKPDTSRIEEAMRLLLLLGAVSESQELTETGRSMADYPVHPRWARVLVEARRFGVYHEAALWVAVSQGSNLFLSSTTAAVKEAPTAGSETPRSDLIAAGYALAAALSKQFSPRFMAHSGLSQRETVEAGQTFKQLDALLPNTPFAPEVIRNLLKCLLSGFPDHIARHVASGSPHYKTCSGVSGQLAAESIACNAPYILFSRIEASSRPGKRWVSLQGVSEIEPEWIEEQCRNQFVVSSVVEWAPSLQRVMEKRETALGQLIWKQEFIETENDDVATEILSQLIIDKSIPFPAWDHSVDAFIKRVRFTARHSHSPGIEDIDEDALKWILQQAIYKARSAKEIARRELWPSLSGWLRTGEKALLDWFAPESIQLPGRRRATPLRYTDSGEVILSDTIQNLYDCPTPVTVAGGHTEVLYELLAPSRRPVQLTGNLDAFWKGSYKEIRKELKGRYPKHEWREY